LSRLRAVARYNPRVVAAPAPAPGYWSPLEIALESILAPERRRLAAAAEREDVSMLRDGSALFGTTMAVRAAALRLRAARAARPLSDALLAALDGYLHALAAPKQTLVVGVLNVTPDSFSDGGCFLDEAAAVARAREMVAEGADWIDVGGESTRPGAAVVPEEEEKARVLPVISALRQALTVPVSIDTRKASVAEAALGAGATIVNDVSGLTFDAAMPAVVAAAGAGLVLMHTRGTPETMQKDPTYDDVVADTLRFLRRQFVTAVAAGVHPGRIWIDPGFGFGKTPEHNLAILRRLREYTATGLPVFLGTSRKSTLGLLLDGAPPEERREGTAATVALAVQAGARAVRVHDVREMARVVHVAAAVVG
jgi:dihydropteroate synthase